NGAAVEAVHRPAEVRILAATHIHRLSVGADHLRPAVPQHQVGVVDAIADDGADFVQDLVGHPRGDVPPGVHGDDLADAALGDRLFGSCVTGVESADVSDHEGATGGPGRLDDGVAVLQRGGHRLFEEDMLAGGEGGQGWGGVLVPHGYDADGLD